MDGINKVHVEAEVYTEDAAPVRYVNTENLTVNKVNTAACPQPGRCMFCWTFHQQSNLHALLDCEKFKNANGMERDAFLIFHKLCQSCLKPGHITMDCPNPAPICSQCKNYSCQERHHPLLTHLCEEHCQYCNVYHQEVPKHSLADCERFEKRDIKIRRGFAEEHKICFSCLKRGHRARRCPTEVSVHRILTL